MNTYLIWRLSVHQSGPFILKAIWSTLSVVMGCMRSSCIVMSRIEPPTMRSTRLPLLHLLLIHWQMVLLRMTPSLHVGHHALKKISARNGRNAILITGVKWLTRWQENLVILQKNALEKPKRVGAIKRNIRNVKQKSTQNTKSTKNIKKAKPSVSQLVMKNEKPKIIIF